MGRQNKDASIVGSSIVLLQERFKQLQRLKEMRQESRMLKLMPQEETDRHDLSVKRFSTTSSSDEDPPLSLGLNSTSHHQTPQQFPAVRGPHNFFEIPDVDTSLRL